MDVDVPGEDTKEFVEIRMTEDELRKDTSVSFCEICSRTFANENAFRLHQIKTHGIIRSECDFALRHRVRIARGNKCSLHKFPQEYFYRSRNSYEISRIEFFEPWLPEILEYLHRTRNLCEIEGDSFFEAKTPEAKCLHRIRNSCEISIVQLFWNEVSEIFKLSGAGRRFFCPVTDCRYNSDRFFEAYKLLHQHFLKVHCEKRFRYHFCLIVMHIFTFNGHISAVHCQSLSVYFQVREVQNCEV